MTFFSNNMFVYLTRMLWRYAGAARKRMVFLYLLFTVANICVALQPIILSRIINTIQSGGMEAIHDALGWASAYAGAIIVFWALHGPARVIERRLAFVSYENFLTSLYRQVTEMPLRWHQDHHSGDTINRLNKAARALMNFGQEQYIIIQMTVRFCVSMVMLGFYSGWVLTTSLAVSGVLALTIRRFDKVLVPLIDASNEREHHLNATLFDYISNIVTILTLRMQANTRREVGHRMMAIKPIFWRETVTNEWKWALVNMTLVIAQAGIIGAYIALHLWRHEALAIGSVIAIFQYLLMISQVFYDAAAIYERLMQRHTEIHGIDLLVADHARMAAVGTSSGAHIWKRIELHGLNFAHHEGEDTLHHLRDISLTITAGKKIALIGSSGSGKTTLLTLLRGLYAAHRVRLTIDDEVFESLAPLSGFTTLVPQDSEIFENTVLYNLTLGTDVPDALVQQAVRVTTFEDVLPKLPQGIATDIRERGVNLSGGQKQRLAFARGLIAARDSSLLLLDEPTSSVDLATESVIFDRLFAAFQDKAMIASVHRLHLLPRFDCICLMKDGAIIEQGSFRDLLASHGAFCRLWQHHLAQSAVAKPEEEKT